MRGSIATFRSAAAGLALAHIPTVASADPDCAFEDWLLQTVYQTEIALRQIDATGKTPNQRSLQETLSALDHPELQSAMRQDGYDRYAPVIRKHVDLARDVLARQRAQSEPIAELRGTTSQLLEAIASVECTPQEAREAQSAANSSAQAVGPTQSRMSHLAQPDWRVMAAMVAALALLVLMFVVERLTRFRLRAAPRFICDVPCKMNVDGQEIECRIVDMSVRGAKLKIGSNVASNKIARIDTASLAINARIIWANHHYCGVAFDRAISSDALEACIHQAGMASNQHVTA